MYAGHDTPNSYGPYKNNCKVAYFKYFAGCALKEEDIAKLADCSDDSCAGIKDDDEDKDDDKDKKDDDKTDDGKSDDSDENNKTTTDSTDDGGDGKK